ncbi:MAG: TonB-dependent receptor domain-containing protein [Muribaculaceae bacterium]
MKLFLWVIIIFTSAVCTAQNITIYAINEPAANVFRRIVEQTGKSFVYSSDLLKDMKVTIDVRNKSLKSTLSQMFKNTDIEYKIKGKNIILQRKINQNQKNDIVSVFPPKQTIALSIFEPQMLDEVVVFSRLEEPVLETAEIGAKKLTAQDIINTPVIFGESDVIKALQMQPGVIGGSEGLAEMIVHGGNADENMHMLDNVPLYQVNHFAGLFSAFNVEAIRYIDFYKSSIPAKYDGRLSSYLDVRTKNGNADQHHGSFKLGLTSGAINIDGPLCENTTYTVAMRRSWFEVFSIPIIAIINSSDDSEKIRFRYAFMDVNGKITHRLSDKTTGFVSIYFGNDILKTGSKEDYQETNCWSEDDKFDICWGNFLLQSGFICKFNSKLSSEFTAAYTRYFSNIKHDYSAENKFSYEKTESSFITETENNINDFILRTDFYWHPIENSNIRFGAGYTLHSFLPSKTNRRYFVGVSQTISRDSIFTYNANEANVYIEDDYSINEKFRMNIGMHLSLFNIDNKTDIGFAPRFTIGYRPTQEFAIKAAYARTNQYVHQLSQTYLSLPTDQWIPITKGFEPQIADKISLGTYWNIANEQLFLSIEGYWKTMRNLVDYRDEYYLQPPMEMWNMRLCSGKGTAKGLDFKLEKNSGKVTGHLSYSLSWANRTFPDKNNGETFPSRFDHRHTINGLIRVNMNEQLGFYAAWTGHSGNRFTLLPQVWESPDFNETNSLYELPLKTSVNNYQLPFYHRLDLSMTLKNKCGYWNFSIFNAYCNMNTVAVRRTRNKEGVSMFQKVKLLPIIPSISYTWLF